MRLRSRLPKGEVLPHPARACCLNGSLKPFQNLKRSFFLRNPLFSSVKARCTSGRLGIVSRELGDLSRICRSRDIGAYFGLVPRRQEAESSSQEERRPREGADDGADIVAWANRWPTAISTWPPPLGRRFTGRFDAKDQPRFGARSPLFETGFGCHQPSRHPELVSVQSCGVDRTCVVKGELARVVHEQPSLLHGVRR